MNKMSEVFAINRNGITKIFSINILGQMQSITDIKKDTKDIKGNTESLKKDIESIKQRQQNFGEDLAQIRESVTKKNRQNIERNNLSDSEESGFNELYYFAFFFELNVINSDCEKFGVASGHTLQSGPAPEPGLSKKGDP